MAIETYKTTKEVIRAEVGNATVRVYVENGDPVKVTIGWPQRNEGGQHGAFEREVLDYPKNLPDIYEAIGEAMEYIDLAKRK